MGGDSRHSQRAYKKHEGGNGQVTQLHSLDANPTSDWKDKYFQALNKFEEKGKRWSQEEGVLYKSILRLIFSYAGLDDKLDQQLFSMRNSLRKESSNTARSKIINPIIDNVINYAQQRDEQQTQAKASADHLGYLLNKLELPDKFHQQLNTIKKSLGAQPEGKNIQACIEQLSSLISQASSAGANSENDPDPNRIELKVDDPLTQLLENLSLPGDLGVEIISMRKRAGEIEEEQERLQLIQDLVQVLSRQSRAGETDDANRENLPHFKETLMELFEWLSIPKEYSKQIESLKSRIATIEGDPDLSVILRDTAIIINDLQSALQIELSDVQNFLAKVTYIGYS